MLVMPGGADLPYCTLLNGIGNQNIKEFVQNGGIICAGSYYGSTYVEFDKNEPLEVLSERELAFFPGKTIGPILAQHSYRALSGVRTTPIRIIDDNNNSQDSAINFFYNVGGYF